MTILAFIGVRFAAKPVIWMPAAFGVVLMLLVIGNAWAFHPAFSKMQPGVMRYVAQGAVAILIAMIISYIAYTLFGNMWLLFGGSL